MLRTGRDDGRKQSSVPLICLHLVLVRRAPLTALVGPRTQGARRGMLYSIRLCCCSAILANALHEKRARRGALRSHREVADYLLSIEHQVERLYCSLSRRLTAAAA